MKINIAFVRAVCLLQALGFGIGAKRSLCFRQSFMIADSEPGVEIEQTLLPLQINNLGKYGVFLVEVPWRTTGLSSRVHLA